MELIPPMVKIRVALSYGSFSGVTQEYADITFFEFLSLSSFEKINCYMAQCPLLSGEGLPEQEGLFSLLADIKIPKIINTNNIEVHLWMNIKPVVSEFHYDSYQNLLCVVQGEKIIELIPPGFLMKSQNLDTEAYNHTVSDKKGHFCITLTKGQILFIPEGWWHKVSSKENTIALSITWKGIDQQILVNGIFIIRYIWRNWFLYCKKCNQENGYKIYW